MNITDQYNTLLSDISSQILQSRYRAARMVNRELLLLYFAVGKQLSEKIATEKMGHQGHFSTICRLTEAVTWLTWFFSN